MDAPENWQERLRWAGRLPAPLCLRAVCRKEQPSLPALPCNGGRSSAVKDLVCYMGQPMPKIKLRLNFTTNYV